MYDDRLMQSTPCVDDTIRCQEPIGDTNPKISTHRHRVFCWCLVHKQSYTLLYELV